jgi:N-formylglutamate amidohydrolase
MDQQTPTAWHLLHTPDMGIKIVRPQGEGTNLVYSLPHSGRYYPDSFIAEARLSGTTLRLSEDAWVDDMVGLTSECGVYGLIGLYARAFCDVNRNPLELDARLIRGELPKAALSLSARVKAGFGVVARRLSADLDIYRQPLDMAEVSRRIELIHRPYHMTLQALLREAGRGGHVRLIDWHSMPSSALLHPSVNGMRPDIVLGTLHGESSADAFVQQVRRQLEKEGLRVGLNRPFAGGYIVEKYGKPSAGVDALQIEINRAIYMNETTLEAHGGLGRLREAFRRLTTALTAEPV